MGRAIPTTGHLKRPQRMDTLACTSHCSAQQPYQHHYWIVAQPDPFRLQPHTQLRQSITNPQCPSRVTSTNNDRESCKCYLSTEQSCQSERTTPITVLHQRTSLARCIPPETPPPKSKANPEATRPIQNHPGDIPSRLPT